MLLLYSYGLLYTRVYCRRILLIQYSKARYNVLSSNGIPVTTFSTASPVKPFRTDSVSVSCLLRSRNPALPHTTLHFVCRSWTRNEWTSALPESEGQTRGFVTAFTQ